MQTLLQQNPEIGIVSTICAALMPLIEALTPILQVLAMAIGLMIGIVTLQVTILKKRALKRQAKRENTPGI